MKTFRELNLEEHVLKAIEKKGFEMPTPIQELAIPRLLSQDVNLIAKARTGTGKTAAFALPLIQKIKEKKDCVEALILVPTRELALQVAEETASFVLSTFPKIATVYGGSSMVAQLKALKEGAEIVVGTPGRVIDHLERASLDISHIKYFILDEADEMLNMGFLEDIQKIFSLANKKASVLMFSATMPKPILEIASQFMQNYEIIEEEKKEDVVVLQEQTFYVLQEKDKVEALARLIDSSEDFYALIFCQTKLDTEDVAKALEEKGYSATALHGDIPQTIREKILERFKKKYIKLLVATDLAARGIDVDSIGYVVNYALPFDSAIYTHRIGRTGRAGKKGVAISFVRPNEIRRMEYIRRDTGYEIKEGSIPSIKEVLEKKRNHILFSLCEKIRESLKEEIDPNFKAFTKKLLEYGSAEDILNCLLALQYERSLSPSQYKSIKMLYREKGKKTEKALSSGNSTRIFIGWGRKEGATKKKIAELLSTSLSIQQHLVDAIEIKDKYSLASLPNKVAILALKISKKNKNMPHIHIDEREEKLPHHSFNNKRENNNKHFDKRKKRK